MTYDLRLTAHAIIEDNDTVDPGVLADKLFAVIPEHAYPEILPQLLRTYVRGMLGQIRNNPFRTEVEAEEPTWVDDEGDENLLPKPKARVSSSRSGRAVEFRAAYQEWLDAPFSVGNVWKRRSEMDFEDLMIAAAERRELAAANNAIADELEYHATLLQEHGVETVAQLPVEVLQQIGESR